MLPYWLLFSLMLFSTPLDLQPEFNKVRYYYAFSFSMVLLVCYAGLRVVGGDLNDYNRIFNAVPLIDSFFVADRSDIHGEIGFQLLISIIKTFGGGINVLYFICPLVSLILLNVGMKKNGTVYVVFGLLIYYARFFLGREMAQIRSAIACSSLIYAIPFIAKKKFGKYFFTLLIASLFHSVALIGIPFYFFVRKQQNKKYAVLIIAISFVIGSIGIVNIAYAFFENLLPPKIFIAYFQDETFAYKLGILNPTLLMQLCFFLIYLFNDKILRPKIPYYDIIGNLYLFSISWLAIFNELSSFAGRVSTFFATVEIIIIPSIFFLFNQKKMVSLFISAYLTIVLYCGLVFYLNLDKLKETYVPYRTFFDSN